MEAVKCFYMSIMFFNPYDLKVSVEVINTIVSLQNIKNLL